MLRPERMSKVSVTGAKSVMDDVIESVHELHRLHLTDYDGSWEGFDNGDPVEGSEEASEKLVTVRGLESTLEVDEDDAGPARDFDPSELESRLEEVRTEVNDLDDARQELRQQLREVEDRIDTLEPFARLGIDLDLLSGYDRIELVVGEGDEAAVRNAYEVAEEVRAVETFGGDGVVAAAVAPAEGVDPQDAASDPLVGVEFARLEVPDAEGEPEDYVQELRHEAEKYESELEAVQSELENLKLEVAGFLLAAEEYLSIQVQKGEAPLQFATTENSFVAEGWIPSDEVDEFESALRDAVGDRVEFQELERAEYDRHGHLAHHGEVDQNVPGEVSKDERPPEEADDEDDASQQAVADGGAVTVPDDPPVVQTNPGPAKSFERLTKMFGTPNYSEYDPTIVFFLTFPVMFGFMIGDVGYGLIYTGIGYYLYSNFDSETFRDIGVVALLAGVFTTIFGVLYGEAFGLHIFTDPFLALDSMPVFHKGLQPSYSHWARFWFMITVLFGVVHLAIGYLFEFFEAWNLHGPWDAITEAGSWLLALFGLWLLAFSDVLKNATYDATQPVAEDNVPLFLFWILDDATAGQAGVESVLSLGFDGFPAWVGMLGAGMFLLGMILLILGPTYEVLEFHVPLAHTLSYLRISAVLLAKAGMAFAVNVLYFGAYETTDGEYHFMISHGPAYVADHYPDAEIIFGGMFNSGVGVALIGLLVLLVGHLVVLLLGITSAGIQGIRLEYFEFFVKFYEGNGREYVPFGQERNYTKGD